MKIEVHEGEYEYLLQTDPKFREFVKKCEGKTIEQLVEELQIRGKFCGKNVHKNPL